MARALSAPVYTLTSNHRSRCLELKMYGPAAPTPPHSPHPPHTAAGAAGSTGGAGRIAMRLLFAALPVVTLGLASWAPSLRFAVIRKRPLDWAVFTLSVVLTVVYVVLLLSVPEDPKGENTSSLLAGLYIVLLISGAVVHAILADRFPRTPPQPPGPYPAPAAPPAPSPSPYGYPPAGYPPPPQQPTPHQQPTLRQPPSPQDPPVPPSPQTPPTPTPPTPAPPTPAPPTRMRQVASELDELEAQLRKRDGQQP